MPEVKDRKKIENTLAKEYSAGFVTKVESETFEPGINEDIVTSLSKIKTEPQWLLDYRLKSYRRWLEMKQPNWSTLNIDPILISSGKSEFFNSLLIKSEDSKISASITSYSPFKIVYAFSIVPL